MTDTVCARCDRHVGDQLPLCQLCADELTADLLAVPALLQDLTITRAGLAVMARPGAGPRSAETPIPVRANARGRGIWIDGDRQIAALDTTIIGWARTIGEQLACSPYVNGPYLVEAALNLRDSAPKPGRRPQPVPDRDLARLGITPAGPTEQAAVWLTHHRAELRAHPDSYTLCEDLAAVVRQTRKIIDAADPPQQIGPCPECGIELKIRADDRGEKPPWVHCRECGEQHEVATVQRLALEAIHDRLFTITEIVAITRQLDVHVSARTLHRWAEPKVGKITGVGYLHQDPTYGTRITDTPIQRGDPAVFRLGEVLDTVRQDRKGTAA